MSQLSICTFIFGCLLFLENNISALESAEIPEHEEAEIYNFASLDKQKPGKCCKKDLFYLRISKEKV